MYNYLEEMTRDILDLIVDYDPEDENFRDSLYDDLWAEDAITGNGVEGRYFKTDEEAHDAVFGSEENTNLLIEALEEFGNEPDDYKKAIKNPHFADTTIRCYLLGSAIDKAIQELSA